VNFMGPPSHGRSPSKRFDGENTVDVAVNAVYERTSRSTVSTTVRLARVGGGVDEGTSAW
jgi:hypothetical protein